MNLREYQYLETQVTMVKCTNAGGRTKGASEQTIVFVHQHGRDDVRENHSFGMKSIINAKSIYFFQILFFYDFCVLKLDQINNF